MIIGEAVIELNDETLCVALTEYFNRRLLNSNMVRAMNIEYRPETYAFEVTLRPATRPKS